MSLIGDFIYSCRKQYGMTQSELAEKLNVSPQCVSNWERGESVPDVAVLPDLARLLHCSVDSILSGGYGMSGYRRYITVSQMAEALIAIRRIGELLGLDHFVYTTIIDSLNKQMNTTIEEAFIDSTMFDLFTGEFLIGCVRNGDYVDPRDVHAHIQPEQCRNHILNLLGELGIR